MAGILPRDGAPPESTENGIDDPLLEPGCVNQYYESRCNPRLDPFAMNALISELINAINVLDIPYDCERLDNLALAFLELLPPPTVQPPGAPRAILQHRVASGVVAGVVPAAGTWVTRPLNVETYDPGNIVSLAADQFTVTINCYAYWESIFFESLRAKTRLFNVTDNVMVDVGLSITSSKYPGTPNTTVSSNGSAFLTAGKTYRLEVWVQSNSDEGSNLTLGRPSSTGVDELYAIVKFWPIQT